MSVDSSERALDRMPVSVIMERKQMRRGQWSFPSWSAIGVVVAGDAGTQQHVSVSRVHSGEDSVQMMWAGLTLNFYKDAGESYWYNLISDHPALFVVCTEDEDEEYGPCLVTASADEASSHVEGDDNVYSVPMPAEIYRALERYVVENYQPIEKKKRKRQDWSKDIR